MTDVDAPRIAPELLDAPIVDLSHIEWHSLDGDVCDELVPWHVQAAPGMMSFRAGREWVVESTTGVELAVNARVLFVLCREVAADVTRTA